MTTQCSFKGNMVLFEKNVSSIRESKGPSVL